MYKAKQDFFVFYNLCHCMNRSLSLEKLKTENFDVCIIGGGASGVGCALDAALRGLKVAIIDKEDFASHTSSKSTKLIHGGVRYLEQAFKNFDFAQLNQVRHGLEERHTVIKNAPYLAHPLALLTPCFNWFEAVYYTIGLTMYDWFAGDDPLPKSRWLSKKKALQQISGLDPRKLHSAVLYYDGQLDDARYCLMIAKTAAETGASVANYVRVNGFSKNGKKRLTVAHVTDERTGETFDIKSKLFINCAGPMADTVRLMANPNLTPRIKRSKGVHAMLPLSIFKNDTDTSAPGAIKTAMLIPKTTDGRVIFAIPWEGELLLGTTDTPYESEVEEPVLEEDEISFLLENLNNYVTANVTRDQVKAGFGGLRPLLMSDNTKKSTKQLLRDHEVEHDYESGLISLMGGKWTTYRVMAKDTIDDACKFLDVDERCTTDEKKLVGADGYRFRNWERLQLDFGLETDICQHLMKKYGARAERVALLTAENKMLSERISPAYPFIKAEVVYSVRAEMAQTIRDVMARRTRLELIDWHAADAAIETVAALMATELAWTDAQTNEQVQTYRAELKGFIKKASMQ